MIRWTKPHKDLIVYYRVSKRGDRWYSSVTGRTYATREAAVRAERNNK